MSTPFQSCLNLSKHVKNLPKHKKNNIFVKNLQKIQNVNFRGENIKDAHRNSAHFGVYTVSWGPLNDHFADF